MRQLLLLLALAATAPLAQGRTVWLSMCFDPGEPAGEGQENNPRKRIYWFEDEVGKNYESATVGGFYGDVTFYSEPPTGAKILYWLYGSSTDVQNDSPSVRVGEGQGSYTVSDSSSGNSCLGARFDWIKYGVKFGKGSGDGGSMQNLSGIVYTNSFALSANGFSKTGYSFQRWKDPRGVFFADGQTVKGSDFGVLDDGTNVVLTAQWTQNVYTVTFDPNGGSLGAASPTKPVTYDDPYGELPAPTRDGHTFDGWYLSGGTPVTASTTVETASSHALYAQWELNTYVLTIASSTGTGTGSVTPGVGNHSYEYGTIVDLVATPSVGCSFAGWSDGVMDLSRAVYVVSNATYSAVFTKDPEPTCTVHFDANGGERGEMSDQTVVCEHLTALTSNAFERTGYQFSFWTSASFVGRTYVDAANVYFEKSSSGATYSFSANWAPNPYLVRFNPNGGTGDMADQAFFYDTPQALAECTFAPPEPGADFWDFVGWSNLTANVFYQPGEVVSNLTAEANGVVDLTAVWSSRLTDYSRALDCYNLNWTNKVMTIADSTYNWVVLSGEGVGDGTDSCVTNLNSRSLLWAGAMTNGTLSFSCKCTGTTAAMGKLTFGYTSNPNLQSGLTSTNIDVAADGEWHRFTVSVDEGAALPCYLTFRNSTPTATTAVLHIDRVTWVPDGSSVEPTGEDARDISGISFDGGVPSLTFTNADERFSYNLRGTNTLTAPLSLWPVLWTTNGTGVITITPPISSSPSFFYYLETTSKANP